MKYRIKDYPDIKEKVEQMSVETLLSKIIIPHLTPNVEYCPKVEETKENFGVFVFSSKAEDCIKMASDINEGREEKALVVSDIENGAGSALVGGVAFPSLRAVAETGNPEYAYKMGKYTAEEMRLAGYHWAFGPCVDILANKDCPVLSLRSCGDTVDEVLDYAGGYMKGLQDNGMIATVKHFPGDGYGTDDQHITVPVNPLSKEEWYEKFGKVYSTLIEEGAMAVMPGHIALPSFDEKDEYMDMYPPATVSKKILGDLLRKELGFEGLIVSDAVNMGGFCGYMNWFEANAKFLEAGGDALLFQYYKPEYIEGMKKQLENGTLSLETLKNRAYRNLCFAREYFETHTDTPTFNREKAEACAKEVCDKSVKIVRNRAGTLPAKLDKNSKILHVVMTQIDYPLEAPNELTERLKEICGTVDVMDDPRPWLIKEAVLTGNYDYVIVTAGVYATYGLNTVRFAGEVARNMMEGWMRFGTPCIFICNGHPYFAEQFKGLVDTAINTYGYNKYTNDKVMELLLGK